MCLPDHSLPVRCPSGKLLSVTDYLWRQNGQEKGERNPSGAWRAYDTHHFRDKHPERDNRNGPENSPKREPKTKTTDKQQGISSIGRVRFTAGT